MHLLTGEWKYADVRGRNVHADGYHTLAGFKERIADLSHPVDCSAGISWASCQGVQCYATMLPSEMTGLSMIISSGISTCVALAASSIQITSRTMLKATDLQRESLYNYTSRSIHWLSNQQQFHVADARQEIVV